VRDSFAAGDSLEEPRLFVLTIFRNDHGYRPANDLVGKVAK